MVTPINSTLVAALFGGNSESTGVGADLLTAWASAKAGVGVDVSAVARDPNEPLAAVWTPGLSSSQETLAARALGGQAFFNTEAQFYADLGATGDYKRLFALYSGLTTLQALAARAEGEDISRALRTQLETHFARGLTEMQEFFARQQFEDVRLAQGDRVDSAQTTLALPSRSEDYLTGVLHRGSVNSALSGLDPNARFDIVATSFGGTERRVAIDLSEMGGLTRSLANIVSFVNGKLSAAGAASRLEVVDRTPKESVVTIGGRTVTSKYTGPKHYALKVDVRASERVAFEPADAEPAFYAVGATSSGARLIKLQDTGGVSGQPHFLDRPGATADPIGAYVATGWFGPGDPYQAAPAGAFEYRTNALMSDGANNFEDKLRAAGEAVLSLSTADGRSLLISTAWRADEAWRVRDGENEDRAILDDLAERLTQLLHEQGVAAGIEVWEDGGDFGFSILADDLVSVTGLNIGGRIASLERIAPEGMVGGLRDGVFARRFEAAGVAGAADLFEGVQRFVITTTTGPKVLSVDGGTDGIDAATLAERLNEQLRAQGVAAAASLVDDGGALTLRIDALHSVLGVNATLNEAAHDAALVEPGAWASGGLPAAGAGQPFGDAVRNFTVVGAAPLSSYADALDIEIVVATPGGNKTVTVSVSAAERAADPDPAPGQWSAAFQARLDAALNAAGVYLAAPGGELSQWSIAESSGQRLVSVSINGDALTLEGAEPGFALGGAFSAVRSHTSAEAATGVSDEVAALVADQDVSITFDTIWGERTVSASLEPGDPRTLESAALRLNEALAAQGYDLGVAAVVLSGGGAGLRMVTGASHSVTTVSTVSLGASAHALTLDPIDALSNADDPPGALRVSERASRGAAIRQTVSGSSPFAAPSANAGGWFPGRAFDVAVGGDAKVATARAVAAGPDGAIYVLADLSGDSATSAIKGTRDVALLKYDSAGKLAFTQILGASASASGFSLAVSDDGKVAVAGAVEGALSGAGAEKGGTDSFVALYGADGAELWTVRRGASANDEARAVAFAPDGSVIVAGQTESALSGAIALGGADGYLRGYSAAGLELFTRQFGTGGADAATALLVRDDGAGGIDIFTGGVEDNRGVVRGFSYSSSSGLSAGAVRDIGFFYQGEINALAADGNALYVGGQTGADRLTLGAAARAAVAGEEGFVARLDADLVSTGLDRASYLGSARDGDSVNALAIVDGVVYAAGVTGGVLAGQGASDAKSAFLARLDENGEAAWSRNFSSASGALSLTGLAVQQSGASALDVLGLPSGTIAPADTAPLIQRSALRVGDEFSIGADGRRLTTIRITAADTLASLAASINRAIGSAGRAEIVREDGLERIKITPRDGQAVRIDAGREGRNALTGLGLTQGIVATNQSGRAGMKAFGLGLLEGDLRLDSAAAITRAKAELSAAASIVRRAYEAIANPNAKELTEEEKALEARRQAASPASEYYQQQLANYQAALLRLGGG